METFLNFAIFICIWIITIFVGIRGARKNKYSLHWMWFGIHPLGALIAAILLQIPPKQYLDFKRDVRPGNNSNSNIMATQHKTPKNSENRFMKFNYGGILMLKSMKSILTVPFILGLLAICTLLFPPWQYTFQQKGISQVQHPARYAFIMKPPIPEYDDVRSGISIDMTRLLIEMGILGIIYGFYILKHRQNQN